MPTAFVIAPESSLRAHLSHELSELGVSCQTFPTLGECLDDLDSERPDFLFLALNTPETVHLEMVEDRAHPPPRIVLVGDATRLAVGEAALRPQQTTFVPLPLDRGLLRELTRTASEDPEPDDSHDSDPQPDSGRFHLLVGQSPRMVRLFERIQRVARSSATVLISGESGSGKELVARTIHDLSRRSSGPFLAVNAGAISSTLMESEFFGHEVGSFTGASRTHRGFFERAHGGTLFLDEVTEMPPELQVKLLRVLETGRVTRVGGEEDLSVDVRVIAATNRSPSRAVDEGDLRVDLYYRLKVLRLHLPPLRHRREDILPLAEHFLEGIAEQEGSRRKSLSEAAARALQRHDWPGNVRELRNAIYTGYLLSEGDRITEEALPLDVTDPVLDETAGFAGKTVRVRVGGSIEDAERRLILETLAYMGGNKTRTAEVLGISLKTLYNRLHAYGEMPSSGDETDKRA